MNDGQQARVVFDLERYRRRVQDGPCFVCAFVAGHPDYQHHAVYEDADTVAFLSRYPTLRGYCLVAPKAHIESWAYEMEEAEFLGFQAVVRTVARALAAVVPTERMYSMSLGSQQGNAHMHGRERHPCRRRRCSGCSGATHSSASLTSDRPGHRRPSSASGTLQP
jgi:diadenosine tetraphosphate (Ap4A) HIT family hydrolase